MLQISLKLTMGFGFSLYLVPVEMGVILLFPKIYSTPVPMAMKSNNGTVIIPLFFASATGNLQAVEVLLFVGVDVNHQANDGLTGLIGAASKGSKEIVQILLAAGADPTIRASQRGVPLHKEL